MYDKVALPRKFMNFDTYAIFPFLVTVRFADKTSRYLKNMLIISFGMDVI